MARTKKKEEEIKTKDENIKVDNANEKDTISKEESSVLKENPIKKEDETPTKPKKLFPPKNDEMILCRSIVLGGLTYVSKRTGFTYRFDNYGSEQYISYGELINMKASSPCFLNEPWMVVDDNESAIKYLGLEKLYNSLITLDNIDNFLRKPLNEIEEAIDKLPKGVKRTLGEKARKMIEEEKLYDNRIIKLLEKKLKIGLRIIE